jgi:hypothetical protein
MQASEPQGYFTYTKTGITINIGKYKGQRLNYLITFMPNEVKAILKAIYYDEGSNYHTKRVITEIVEDLFKTKIKLK